MFEVDKIFQDNLKKVHIPRNFFERFQQFYDFLLTENQKYNITRITECEEYWIKHIYDSLLLAECFPEIAERELKLLDIGCGGGFPSLILAAAFPDLSITAVDSIRKKTEFVKLAAERLNLENLIVMTSRGRELSVQEEFQSNFDIITARAVADCSVIYRETRRMLNEKGSYLLFKTPAKVDDELSAVRARSKGNGFVWDISPVFELPMGMGQRVFVKGQKNPC